MEVERDDLSQLEQELSQSSDDNENEQQEQFQWVPPQVISSTSNMVQTVFLPATMTTSFNAMFGCTSAPNQQQDWNRKGFPQEYERGNAPAQAEFWNQTTGSPKL